MANEPLSIPVDQEAVGTAPHVVIDSHYCDVDTDGLWMHKDYVQVRADWETEAHINPIQADESFGDVDSWVAYVKAHGETPLLTWNSTGFRGVMDYHAGARPGRCQHLARLPFQKSAEWCAWTMFANGSAHRQREAIERIEDLAEDIVDPPEVDLLQILRSLRANVTTAAAAELREDGSTNVSFSKDERVTGKGHDMVVSLPGVVRIAIPVLHGDTDRWEVKVRLRVSIGDDAKLGLRLSLVNADRVLEQVYQERVQAARTLLGDAYPLLRAHG